MKPETRKLPGRKMAQIRRNLRGKPGVEGIAELMSLAGNSTRLKLLLLLENVKELNAGDLAEMLGISTSAVSQHLARLTASGLVAPRRAAHATYYHLTEHPFNAKLSLTFFKPITARMPVPVMQSAPPGEYLNRRKGFVQRSLTMHGNDDTPYPRPRRGKT
jgi:ArsR family transcriptional regulator, virulence genes transcriptional regulator